MGEDFFCRVKFAQIAAQNGIDKSGLRAEAGTFGGFNRFVDGGVRRNAVEPENLIKAESQKILQRGFLLAAICFFRNKKIERRLPANAAINNFVTEAAVGRGKF